MSVPHLNLTPAAEGQVLGKAVARAAERLDLTARALGAVIGLSEPTVSRLRRGAFVLERGTKPFELAVLLVRFYRSLDAIVGGEDALARAWLRGDNTALGGKPIELIRSVTGL